ncbi:Ger(x)C family spore germination protein [Brevibacillus humidisoli]|uniref:Ger(x)C family spore germination protein n=1 Tax=Brevibacillus humidisoli TaxID=2895522 RepID=UPI001E498A4E|nr:Ger(x)C family spore germination protein [Brevibacillus humidisoli]UFJ38939.1 Ger(x)C family spore germination protein [Brevibacillus humidisoli]
MNKSLLVCLIAILLMLLPGCATIEYEMPSLEEYGFMSVIGFDYVDEKKVKVVISVPQTSQEAKEKTQIYKANVKVAEEALMVIPTKSEKTIVPNQLRVILFSETFARKKGLNQPMRWLYRDPRVGDNVLIGIVKGSVEALMTAKYENKPEMGTFLNDLLRPRTETAFHAFTTIHDYIHDSTGECKDPTMPLLEKKQGDVQITKTVILKNGKLAGYLSPQEGKIVQALTDREKLPAMFYTVEDTQSGKPEKVVMQFIKSSVRKRNEGSWNQPAYTINLSMNGDLHQYTGKKDLERPEELAELQQEINKEMERLTLQVLRKLQKMGVDPAGFAELIRNKYTGRWNRQIGIKSWKKATFQVKVDLKIIGLGTLV